MELRAGAAERSAAVVDLGSNSWRFVAYRYVPGGTWRRVAPTRWASVTSNQRSQVVGLAWQLAVVMRQIDRARLEQAQRVRAARPVVASDVEQRAE